jgi:hypothetical protein
MTDDGYSINCKKKIFLFLDVLNLNPAFMGIVPFP